MSATPPSAPSHAAALVGAFDARWNAHDEDGVVASFAPDAVVSTTPPMPGTPGVFEGTEQVRAFVRALLPGFHVDSTDARAAAGADALTWDSVVRADAFRALGLEAARCTAEARLRDGRVAAFRVTFAPETVAALSAAVVRRFLERGLGRGDLAVMRACVHEDVAWHGGSLGEVRGRDAFERFVAPFFTAFPDLSVVVDDLIAAGDRVAVRLTARGTHRGDFVGVAATGREVSWTDLIVYRVAAGQIAEEWAAIDVAAIRAGIGA